MQKGVLLLLSQQQSEKRCAASSVEVWVLAGAAWRGSGISGKEQHLHHVSRSGPQPAGMAAAAEVTIAVVARQHGCIPSALTQAGHHCLWLLVWMSMDSPWLNDRQLCVPPPCQLDHPDALHTA